MIFAAIGILKQPVEARGPEFESALNEHWAQDFQRIINAGYLRGPGGQEIGILGIIEADTFERAQAYLDGSPFVAGGYCDHVHLAQFDVEVGRLA